MGTQKKRLSKAKIRAAKSKLRLVKKKYKLSLRDMVSDLNHRISYQQLGRFIKEQDYVPTQEEVCDLLDLYAEPNPYRGMPRWWARSPEAAEAFNKTKENIRWMYGEQKKSIEAAKR